MLICCQRPGGVASPVGAPATITLPSAGEITADDGCVVDAVRIAKEEQEKSGDNEQGDADDGSREQPDERSDHQGPEDERPTGRVDSHKVVSSLWPDEAEVETGSDFRGLKHSGKPNPVSQARGQEALKWDLAYSSAICSI